MLEAQEDRDKYKKEIERLTEELEKQKSEVNNLNVRNKRLTAEVNMEQYDQYKNEINDLKKENDHLLKMLIKRCKKDVINQTRDYSPSMEIKKPSPSKDVLLPVAVEKGKSLSVSSIQSLLLENSCLVTTQAHQHLWVRPEKSC
jgi:DNA repair exonuclease SbcCD ATPase subunit